MEIIGDDLPVFHAGNSASFALNAATKIIPSPLHKIAHRVNINVGHSITADALPAILGAFYGRDALQLTALCD
jgi:hypothetical protein